MTSETATFIGRHATLSQRVSQKQLHCGCAVPSENSMAIVVEWGILALHMQIGY